MQVTMMELDVLSSGLAIGEQVYLAGFHLLRIGKVFPDGLLRRDDEALSIKLQRGLVVADDVVYRRVIRH